MHKYALAAALCALACVDHKNCDNIITDSYDGFAIAFYHRPVSGSTYEIYLFPACDSNAIKHLSGDFEGVRLGQGVSFNLTSGGYSFLQIEKGARKLRLTNKNNFDPTLRVIYYCPIQVKIDRLEKDFQSVTANEGSPSEISLHFENNTTLDLKYFFCVDFAIEALKPIRQ